MPSDAKNQAVIDRLRQAGGASLAATPRPMGPEAAETADFVSATHSSSSYRGAGRTGPAQRAVRARYNEIGPPRKDI